MTDKQDGTAAGPESLNALRAILANLPGRLAALSEARAATKPAPDKWSPKEVVGHLIDSAFNNHRRVVLAQLEDGPALPEYDGDGWVALHGYQRRPWPELIELWRAGNQQLLAAAEAASEAAWARTLTVGSSGPMTLAFLVEDYVRHLLGHLQSLDVDAHTLTGAK